MAKTNLTITIEQLAKAALKLEYLKLRALTQEFLRQNPQLSGVNRPNTNDSRVLATAASLLELFAFRSSQTPPSWTKKIGPLREKTYLIDIKTAGKFTRQLCDTEAPPQLRGRNIFALPNFLEYR